MNNKEFYELFEKLHKEEMEIMLGKGKEYCQGSEDKLANFKTVAKNVGLTPIKTWAVYFEKHLSSLKHWINGGEISSEESIESRITDLRNYLALLVGLIKDKE